jgi:hypothetical protein
MNHYQVTRQQVNCGPTQEIFVKTIEEARRAFDIAVSAGDVFAEIFDMDMDAQVMMHLTPSKHTIY